MKWRYLLMSLMVGVVVLFAPMSYAQESKVYGLTVGEQAPDFEASTYQGNKIILSDMYKDGPVVLVFYRGQWCPICNLHLKSFQAQLAQIENLGAKVLAVSVDKPEYGNKIVTNDALGFEVISDPDAEILKSYNVIYQVPDELAAKYLTEYQIDLEAHSGRKDHMIAVPATYVIDSAGTIIFAYANEDYKVRTKPEEVIDVLKRLQEGK